MKCKVILATAVATMACSAAFAAGRTMLAVPARHDMVGFGFDMLRQMPDNLELACYKGDDRIERLEVFDRTAWEWRTLSAASWAAGVCRADSLVVAGENKAAADLLALSGWTRQTKMPCDRAKLDVVNAVNAYQPLTDRQWKNLADIYGFKFTKVERPSPRERLRDEARARRDAARARREEAKARKEREQEIERQRKLMRHKRPEPQIEVVPAPVVVKPAPAPVEVKPAPAPVPVEVKPAPVPVEVKPAPVVLPATVEAEPPAVSAKAPEAPLPEASGIVFKKREPEVKPPEAKPAEAEAKVKAAVEAAVSEAAAKQPKVEAPATVEIRVPAKEAATPASEAPAVPEVKIPEVKAPEAAPVQTPEIKVPAIVLDPM